VVLDTAPKLGYQAHEDSLTWADIENADEVFLSNALAGVVPVRGREGPASEALARAFARIWSTHRG
jgi:branched-subunit amino acid aminotransferase/4-amino-4-deoxychorismate lyase